MSVRAFASLLLATVLAGCAANPMTGRSQLMLVSENSVLAQAASAYAQELAPWEKKGKLNNDPALKARVDAITNRLIAQAIRYRPETANWDWQVAVIDEPNTLNAYCLPGGRMAIYTGIIQKLQLSDDEIAQIMGHEIGHALANHGAEKMSNAMAAQTTVALVGALAGQRNQGVVSSIGPAMAQLGWLLPNSRQAEHEADTIGMELAARAGYDPAAGVSLWRKMREAAGSSGPQFLSTHPAPEERMKRLAELAVYMQPIYAEAKAGPLPSFTPRMASNVRDVGPAAHVAPAGMAPLMLVSPAYEEFKRGNVRLGCDDCALKFNRRKAELKRLYEAGDWERLARAVLDIGYRQDISWFYLAAAAEGQGRVPHARAFYAEAARLAREKATHCKGGLLDLCNDIRLPEAAEAALARLGGN